MKKIPFILIAICLFSCKQNYRVARITHSDEAKIVEVQWGDSIIPDTTFVVAPTIPDSIILKQLRHMEDSLRLVAYNDSIRLKAYQDSLAYIQFQADSISFRKITKKINGGYNGWDDRYKKWLNNLKVLESYGDTIFN